MTPFVQDTDFTLFVGDVREVLAGLPDESVQCVVTSPPYWGLRDYGTGSWDGGDPDCDHSPGGASRVGVSGLQGGTRTAGHQQEAYRGVCGKCGATRTDQQIGLEPTPELYVENMVAMFREVRRVLRKDGTLWLNIGDSYAGSSKGGAVSEEAWERLQGDTTVPVYAGGKRPVVPRLESGISKVPPGLKPKDLVGIPWRLAFALQADGWYLRSEIIWSKPNPMPESVTDRPTKAHEQVFLLTRSPRYFFDQESVREPHMESSLRRYEYGGAGANGKPYAMQQSPNGNEGGRNLRSVWEIPTQPFAEAHFATYPQALVERCVKAGCPEWVCGTCGKARERILKRQPLVLKEPSVPIRERRGDAVNDKRTALSGTQVIPASAETVGWSDCGHNNYQPGVVLDPFLGSGTTALVARRLGRRSVGIELNPEYADMAAKRLSQLSLLA